MELKDKVVAVTGATSGIGLAVAHNLRGAGMKLVVAGRREERLKKMSAELGETAYVAGDMTDPAVPGRIVQKALSEFGRCDAVINNAGTIEMGSVEEIDIDRMCGMVRLNTEAAFRMIYVALRHFRSVGGGDVITTSSVLGKTTRPRFSAYAGTKYAIEGLCEGLRKEMAGTGVRVMAVQPGLVMTELHDGWEVHPKDAQGMKTPLQPEDIARSVRFMLEQPDHVVIPQLMVLPAEAEI